jgi:hypothetical protein
LQRLVVGRSASLMAVSGSASTLTSALCPQRDDGPHAVLAHVAQGHGRPRHFAAVAALRLSDKPQLDHPRRQVGRPRVFEVRPVDATGRLALLRTRLGPPHAVIGEAVCEIAKADLWAVFGRQSSEPIGPTARTVAATDSDDDKGIMSKAIPVVHAGLFAFCSQTSIPG